jgi:hypothetical protein
MKPPTGKNAIIHKWDSLQFVAQSKLNRKKAETLPTSTPIIKQMRIHFKR